MLQKYMADSYPMDMSLSYLVCVRLCIITCSHALEFNKYLNLWFYKE